MEGRVTKSSEAKLLSLRNIFSRLSKERVHEGMSNAIRTFVTISSFMISKNKSTKYLVWIQFLAQILYQWDFIKRPSMIHSKETWSTRMHRLKYRLMNKLGKRIKKSSWNGRKSRILRNISSMTRIVFPFLKKIPFSLKSFTE